MYPRHILRPVLVLGTLMLLCAPSGYTITLTFTTIDVPGSSFTNVQGLNNAGQLVGTFADSRGVHGFVWHDGRVTTLDVPGSHATTAIDMNETGQIAGSFNHGQQGFVWRDGRFMTLDIPGGSETVVQALNNAGQVVGTFFDGSRVRGFMWSDGRLTTLEIPANPYALSVVDINETGQIAGSFGDGRGFHGFVWRDGRVTTLDGPGSRDTVVRALNNAGQVVGTFVDARGQHGFVWHDGHLTALDVPGSSFTIATDINDSGQIVGLFSDTSGVHGFLFSEGRFTTFDPPGGRIDLLYPPLINARGQIAGEFSDTRGFHGFLATPVLEPRTLVANTPGSFLVYPFFTIAEAVNTTLCVTDTADGPFNQTSTWVRFNVVCKGVKGPNPFCDTFEAHFPITYHGTVCIDLKNDPRYTPPCAQGFVVAFAETTDFIPQSHNTLVGHTQVTAPNVLAEAKALAVQSSAPTGNLLGGPGGDVLTFGQSPADYVALPTTLYGTFRAFAPGQNTTLVVLTLDTIAGGQNQAARMAIDFWNANEVRFSAAHEFVCWDAVPLAAIDSRFSATGLGSAFGSLRITATSNCPFPGSCPPLPLFTPTILGTLVDGGPGAVLGVRNLFHMGSRSTTYFPE